MPNDKPLEAICLSRRPGILPEPPGPMLREYDEAELQKAHYLHDVMAERNLLREALAAVEWGGRSLEEAPWCSQCGKLQRLGHEPNCIVGLALKGCRE